MSVIGYSTYRHNSVEEAAQLFRNAIRGARKGAVADNPTEDCRMTRAEASTTFDDLLLRLADKYGMSKDAIALRKAAINFAHAAAMEKLEECRPMMEYRNAFPFTPPL
jgi:hypothetical protein